MEGDGALLGHLLTDNIRDAGSKLLLNLLGGQVAAVAIIAGRHAGSLLNGADLLQPVLVAEAVVGCALFHQLQRVVLEHSHALALDIGTDRTADVRPLIPDQAGFLQGVVDDIHRTLDIPLLVGILNAQDELAAVAARPEIGIQRGAQVAQMHIAGRAGRKARADFGGHGYRLSF